MNPSDPTNDHFHDCSGCGRPAADCECDECYHCGAYPCECEPEEDYDRWDDLDGAIATRDRWFLADWTRDMLGGVGVLDVIARKATKHGVGLGGYPWQKRANKRRLVQLRRKAWPEGRTAECSEHKGDGCPDDCMWVPF